MICSEVFEIRFNDLQNIGGKCVHFLDSASLTIQSENVFCTRWSHESFTFSYFGDLLVNFVLKSLWLNESRFVSISFELGSVRNHDLVEFGWVFLVDLRELLN